MIRDPMFLLNIQLAFIGIVLVAGLFYIWRLLVNIEKKVEKALNAPRVPTHVPPMPVHMPVPTPIHMNGVNMDNAMSDELAEALMNEVFGNLVPKPMAPSSVPEINVEDVTSNSAEPTRKEEEAPAQQHTEPTPSEVGSITVSKLKRLSLDALQKLCNQHNVSAEGTKAVLIQRLMPVLEDSE
jgi:hypothetical protein